MLAATPPLIIAGVYDGLSARIAEAAGFEAIYLSGGAVARSMGYPDLGLVSFAEMAQRLREVRAVTTVPIIADADTGYGNVANVLRTVRAYEQAGAAALHIEDQMDPKRCGHLDGKALVSAEEMAAKIRAAVLARADSSLMIIARTDALAVEGFDAAIARGKLYTECGADMVFVEAPESEAEIERVAGALHVPLVINMFVGGKTPVLSVERVTELGYAIVLVPSDLQRAAIYGMQEAARIIRETGSTVGLGDKIVSFAERESIVETNALQELAERLQNSATWI